MGRDGMRWSWMERGETGRENHSSGIHPPTPMVIPTEENTTTKDSCAALAEAREITQTGWG